MFGALVVVTQLSVAPAPSTVITVVVVLIAAAVVLLLPLCMEGFAYWTNLLPTAAVQPSVRTSAAAA
jgi:hypothetical protein